MKNTGICPKCKSTNILNENPAKVAGNSHVCWAYQTGFFKSPALAKRYICLDCGYAEVWFEQSELDKIKDSL